MSVRQRGSSFSLTPALHGLSGEPDLLGSEYPGITEVRNSFYWFPKSQQQAVSFSDYSPQVSPGQREHPLDMGSTLQCRASCFLYTHVPLALMSGLEESSAQLSLWNFTAMSPCSLCSELPVAQGVGQSDGSAHLSENFRCLCVSCWCCACHCHTPM